MKWALLGVLWPRLFVPLARAHLAGLIPCLLATRILLPLWWPHLSFLPLLITSVYCSVGLTIAFLVYIWINVEWLLVAREEVQMVDEEEKTNRIHLDFCPLYAKKST